MFGFSVGRTNHESDKIEMIADFGLQKSRNIDLFLGDAA